MGRKRTRLPGPDRSPVCARVRETVERQWAGDVARAAKALAVSYWTVLRVARGSTPPADLLAAIVEGGHADAHWLLTGRHPAHVPPCG